MNFIENVKWALAFAETKLDTLRAGDRLNLISELHEFFVLPYASRLVVTAYGVPQLNSATAAQWSEIAELQKQVRGLLHGLVHTQKAYGVPVPEIALKNVTLAPSASPPVAKPDPAVAQDKASLHLKAPWREAFLLLLGLSLWEANIDNVKACPECGKLFLRVRRQAYCSRKCTNAATVRDWRTKKENQEQEREKAKARYERKVKAKPRMENVQVGRKRERVDGKRKGR